MDQTLLLKMLTAYRSTHLSINNFAAALRAAADQVVPEHREHYPATLDERYRKVSAFDVRNKFLANRHLKACKL
jgi:hypothetical protein